MSYIGNGPPLLAQYGVESFNGGGTSFTLSKPATTATVLVFIDGVRQTPTDAYSVSGVTLTTTATTPSGTDNVTVQFLGDVVDFGEPSDASVTAAKLNTTGTASSSTYLRGDMAWAAVVVGSITTEGDYFYNYNTISSNLTTTVATTKAAFVAGPITIADTYTWTISGELTMI